jgi:hypothetical protein
MGQIIFLLRAGDLAEQVLRPSSAPRALDRTG